MIKFNQHVRQKPHIVLNTDLQRKANNGFEKDLLKLMNNAALEKAMENVRENRDVELVTAKRRRNYLMSERDYHSTKFFT